MKLIPVESSNIARIGYDSETRDLLVEFKGGRSHRYTGVPPEVYAEFMSAHSHGQYFARHIRGTYSSERADDPYPKREADDEKADPAPERNHHVIALEAAARRFRGEQ